MKQLQEQSRPWEAGEAQRHHERLVFVFPRQADLTKQAQLKLERRKNQARDEQGT